MNLIYDTPFPPTTYAFHVLITAIQEECNYILTTNHRRFPSKIGNIQRVHPSTLYEEIINP